MPVRGLYRFDQTVLAGRGSRLAWVRPCATIGRSWRPNCLQRSCVNASVLVTGGIGATPDDHTRQAVAETGFADGIES